MGGFACGSVSGGALNPAVALGLAVSGGGVANALAYAAAQLLAGGAAAGVFKVTHQATSWTSIKNRRIRSYAYGCGCQTVLGSQFGWDW